MLKKIEIMIMIMIRYNILQKSLIFQKYKKMFSRKIRHAFAISSGSIRWISIRFDAGKFNPWAIQLNPSGAEVKFSLALIYLRENNK